MRGSVPYVVGPRHGRNEAARTDDIRSDYPEAGRTTKEGRHMKDQANEQQIGPVMRPSLSRIDREMLRAILK
jgi:hypothetical protein